MQLFLSFFIYVVVVVVVLSLFLSIVIYFYSYVVRSFLLDVCMVFFLYLVI